jgi:hypothetical protein
VRTHTRVAHRSANLCQPASLQGLAIGRGLFLSARVGVGITAAGFSCPVPSRGGTVTWRWQAEPVRLAMTCDGGRTWQAEGVARPLSLPGSQPVLEQVVANSTTNVDALAGEAATQGPPIDTPRAREDDPLP